MPAVSRRWRALAQRVLPRALMGPIVAVRERRLSHQLNSQWQVDALSRRLFERVGTTVLAGPFAGLVLPKEIASEHVGPYLFGVYEHELRDTLATLSAGQFGEVVNVGAKFGYYAVGLAKLLGVHVAAFDADPWARRMTRRTAALNDVAALVTVSASCRREDLSRLGPNALVVIDCDGCEMQLLAPPIVAGLRHATIIVEVHEMVESGSGRQLQSWLETSHEVREIPSAPEAVTPPLELPGFSAHDRALAVREIRPHQSWLVCTPKRSRPAG